MTRHLVAGQPFSTKGNERGGSRIAITDDKRHRVLPARGVRHADNVSLAHVRVGAQNRLDFATGNVYARRLDHVLDSTPEVQEPLGIERASSSGVKKAALIEAA